MVDGAPRDPAGREKGPNTGVGERVGEVDRGDSATEPVSGSRSTSLCAAVVTISSTRTIETDESSAEIVDVLEAAGHVIATRERIDTSHDTVQSTVSRLIDRDDVDFVVTAGATGVDPTDVTIEAVRPILDRELPAFGQLFTTLAYERVGTRIVAGRTLAGVTDGVLVFCLPGHPEAARLAIEAIVVPEIAHLVAEATGENEGTNDADEDGTDVDGETDGTDDDADDSDETADR